MLGLLDKLGMIAWKMPDDDGREELKTCDGY
jgi:hypothetical protein